MRLHSFVLVALLAGLAACQPVVANRGNILDQDALSEIKAGISTREEVASKLGSPTQISAFDEKVWYYIGRRTKQTSFFDPVVTEQKAVEVRFDDQGVVKEVKDLDVAGAKEVSPVSRSTPTYGRDDTFIKQLLGNLSRPRPMQNRREQGN